MKQRITVDQLKELSPEQQERLRERWKEWRKPEEGDRFATPEHEHFIGETDGMGGTFQLYDYKYALPLLSIGQLIQLLKEHDKCLSITHLMNYTDGKNYWCWQVELRHLNAWEKSYELVDALWEVLKEIL